MPVKRYPGRAGYIPGRAVKKFRHQDYPFRVGSREISYGGRHYRARNHAVQNTYMRTTFTGLIIVRITALLTCSQIYPGDSDIPGFTHAPGAPPPAVATPVRIGDYL